MKHRIMVATRGSAVALQQINRVLALLKGAAPQLEFERLVIRSRGDREPQAMFSRPEEEGILVRDLEVAVRDGQADIAVHHFKDVPYTPLPGLLIPCVPFRLDSRDCFLSSRYPDLKALPRGACIAIRGLRRRAQLLAIDPTFRFLELEGGFERRLYRLGETEVDAFVMAAYGIELLNQLSPTGKVAPYYRPIPYEQMLPAAAQGAIALECRTEDSLLLPLLAHLDDPELHAAVTAERAFFKAMFGGYVVPTGVHGWCEGNRLFLDGLLASPDGRSIHRLRGEGPLFAPEILGGRLARTILESGASEYLSQML